MGKSSKKKKYKKHDGVQIPEEGHRTAVSGIKGFGVLKNRIIHIILIVLTGILIYWNTFDVPFQFDDAGIIKNPLIENLNYLHPSAMGGVDTDASKSRYIGYLTFALNYKINGLNVFGYHMVNLLIHLLSSLLVYILITLTFRTPYLKGSGITGYSGYIALFTALFFVSHPVQTQAVTYIVQRFASLATMFYLISITAYIRARVSDSGLGRYALYVVSLVSAVLAMKTKEISFTLPVVICLYEYMFFQDKIRKRIVYLLPLILTMLIIPLTIMSINKPAGNIIGDIGEAARAMTTMPRLDYLFTQFSVIVRYIRLLFFPVNQNFDYDYPVYHSFLNSDVFMSFIFLSAIFGAGLYLYKKSRKKDPALRLISFGIFWFFITLSVESSIIPIVDVIFEHRIYLPSIGAFAAVTTGIFLIAVKTGSRKAQTAVVAMLFLTTVVLSGTAFARNKVWKTEVSIWEDVVEKSPQKARGHNNLGNAYKLKGDIKKAIEQFEIAVKINPNFAKAYYNLGVSYWSNGMKEKALDNYRIALKLNPNYAEAHNNLGAAYKDKNLNEEAIEEYEAALKIVPEYAEAHNNLGAAYRSKGLIDKAIEHYNEALRIKPYSPEVHNNLGAAYRDKGMKEKAVQEYEIAIRLRPDFMEAHYNLGYIYFEKKEMEMARKEFETVLRIKPDMQYAKQLMGIIGKTNK
ncbi:MAG: hypothetical protein A2X59_05165 [Nitrospirae bacterium GWC2_42_7]|nr:MAG: hypothetical protein A2X59_05165 [Nitrospirae bacterium GWC2_42_7]